MGRIKEKKGRSRPRIIESDSESEADVDELSMSMNRVQLIDEPPPKSDSNFSVQRKPPRGRRIQRLEDFSWSSSDEDSDEESEGSYTTSCSSNKNKPEKQIEEKSTMPRNKRNASSVSSPSANHPTILSSDKKTSDSNASFTSTRNKSVRSKVKSSHVARAFSSDISFSDSSSSSLSILLSSDDESTESNQKRSKKKQHFSWSFNKNRQEYTIAGNSKLPAFSIPSDLYDQLYDFQKEGVMWMASLHLPQIGGILGDDMGMGKTFTTLAFLGGLMKAKTIKKAIVVAPVSVLRNWENEANKILRQCVGIKIQVLSSDISVYNRKKRLHQALEAHSAQLVITSFGLVASNPDHFTQHVVGKQVWDYVILDEAHKIKNPNTNNNKAVEMIAKSRRTRRLILTGTPIMNNLKELHTLFDFATSGKVLGSHKDFLNEFGKPIEAARSKDAEDDEVERGEEAMQELQELIQPYFLQRMKSDCLAEALPSKHEYVLWTNLSHLQREMYIDYIQSEHVSGILGGEAKSPLFAITWLQKLCGHPLLLEKKSVEEIDNFDDHDPNELMEASAKLEVMYNLVDSLISNGHRTLIFSQSTKVLDIIDRVLKQQFKLSRIDGQTKGKDRQRLVDEFNQPGSDVDIMLISTKAGGQGLTLTGADSCVVYDPSWSPAEDAQAVDRCYRLGQKKRVQVFRLITAGTVEEKRYEKQIHKDGIRRTILTNTGIDTAKYFTKEELQKKLFLLGEEGECEFLDKLQKRGFSYDEKENPEHSYSSHKGVVGQSSHDIVYSLPENFYLEESIQSPTNQPFSSPPQPFSSPPIEAQWVTKKTEPKIMGRSLAVLSEKTNCFDNKENKEKNYSSKTEKTKFVDGESKLKLRISVDSQASTMLEKTLSKANNLRRSGKKEQAVSLLMDLLDHKSGTLSKDDLLKVHDRMIVITSELGWLVNQN